MLTQSMLALSLLVRIHDAYGVAGEHLAKARATTEGIMRAAGVAVAWPRCPCLTPVSSSELVVRIAGASPSSMPRSLGFSFVDIAHKTGTLATVFADRVQAMAALADIDDGELMGRVIAHEISHLLLGTRDHETSGLMRGVWTASELARQRPSDWLLSRAEGRKIRQAIRQRSSGSPPVLMTVDADLAPDASAQ